MNFLIQIIVGIVLSVASTLLQQAFAPRPQEQQARRTGTRGAAQIGGKVPQSFLVGTVGDAGKLEYQNAWGNDGEVPNAYLTSIYSFGDLPINSLTGLFVNGIRHAIPVTGSASAGSPVPTLENKFWWKFFDGDQVSADAYLMEAFGNDASRPWTSDMVGRGVPYLVATALWDEALWTGFPNVLGEFQGIRLYDPRKDSTAGGSGPQRWGQPGTYAFSDNSMVIIYNIERGIYYAGTHVWGGKKTAAEMPYAAWAAAMDACDLPIALAGTNPVQYEPQFRAGRRIALNERPADVIRDLLIGCNGRILHAADGLVRPLVGVPASVDGAFSDADVLATNPLGSIPFPNLDSIINGATATYREPAQAWEDKETAPYLRADLEAEDDGRQQIEGLDLGTTFSGTQAQRVIKAVIEEGRRFRTHVVALPPEFAQFRVLQQLAWTSSRFDYSAKRFLITARTVEPFGNVIFGLQEIDPADHNWVPNADQKPLSFAPVVTNRPAPQEVSGFFVEPAIWVDSQGRSRRPAIDVFWSAPSVTIDVDFVRISHRVEGETDERWVGLIPRPQLLEGSARIVEALLPDEDYEVQIQYIAGSGRQTLASGWLAVHTPDIRLGPLDVVYGDIDLDELGQQIDGYFDWLGSNIRDVIEKAQEQDLHGADQELSNALQFDEMRRSLSVTANDLKASFEETITVVITPQLLAIADQLTVLDAEVGDVAASVTVRGTAQASPGGGWARWGVEVKTTTGGNWSSGAFFIDTNGSLSRAVFVVDQFVVNSGSVVATPFIFDGSAIRVANAFIANLTSANIQAGSITADRLNVTALSALSADLGTVTAGTISLGGGLVLIDGPNVRIVVSD